jgi:predicted CXXCH cytochrome family protein
MSASSDSFWSAKCATRARVFACAVLLLVLGAAAAFFAMRRSPHVVSPAGSPSADPRLSYSGRFLNVHPSVGYVGDAVCGECHLDTTRSFREHPMGQSLAAVREVLEQIPSDGDAASFTAYRNLFRVERRGERLFHIQAPLDAAGQPIGTLETEVQYVIGSGTRGYSYLSERGGFLFQTPISWFSQKHLWGLSPGFTPARFPGRPISGECLFCHANRTRPRPDTVNGYETPIFQGHAIGCERCHGPGERHVRERGDALAVEGPIDETIFNPSKRKHGGRIEPALRDAVCEQCHLSGETRVLHRGRDLYDFRPAMSVQQFWAVFVRDRREGRDKAVNHVEQMHQSLCYQRSTGADKLECVSCHNPHEKIAGPKRVPYYRARCLECHEQHGCSLPRPERLRANKEDSCIDCHMPRYAAADIPHTAATDHRIIRRRGPESEGAEEKPLIKSVKSFYEESGDEREWARDRAVALIRLIGEGKGEPRLLARQALDLLSEPLSAWPDDLDAWEAQGAALNVMGRVSEALSAFEKVLQQAPNREQSLRAAAWLAKQVRQGDKSIDYWRRAVRSNPQRADYRADLARVLADAGAWEEAREHCQTWVRMEPASIEARKLLIRCLRHLGDDEAALREGKLLRRLEE